MPQSARRREPLLHLLTRPPKRPLLQITIYLAALVLLGTLLVAFVPPVGAVVTGTVALDSLGGRDLRDLLENPALEAGSFAAFDAQMLVVMIGTLLITIPFSWGYMAIRARTGYEQSVVQTLVALPIVVAAIMLVIQNSLALAFALGGVAAAVRFRNTLKDVADATYVFLAIGLGIAAGSGTLSGALIMMAIFSYVSIILWRCDFGRCAMTVAASADAHAGPAPDAGRPRRVRGEFVVDVPNDAARTRLERVLSAATKGWKVARTSRGADGVTRLHYDVRLKRSASVASLSNDILEQGGEGATVVQFLPRAPETA